MRFLLYLLLLFVRQSIATLSITTMAFIIQVLILVMIAVTALVYGVTKHKSFAEVLALQTTAFYVAFSLYAYSILKISGTVKNDI